MLHIFCVRSIICDFNILLLLCILMINITDVHSNYCTLYAENRLMHSRPDYFRSRYQLLTFYWLGILIWRQGHLRQLLIKRYNLMSNSVIYKDQWWELYVHLTVCSLSILISAVSLAVMQNILAAVSKTFGLRMKLNSSLSTLATACDLFSIIHGA